MEALTPEIKAEFERLGKNLARIETLETEIKTLKEQGGGVAEIKAEVNKLAADNAEAVKAIKDEQQKRQDDFEAEAMKRLSRGGAAEVKTAGRLFTESDAFKNAPNPARMDGHVMVPRAAATKAVTVGGDVVPSNRETTIVRPQEARLAMRDLIPFTRTARDTVKYPRLSERADAAAIVAEGAAKPESDIGLTIASAELVKIAHYIPVSEEQLSDVDGLAGLIDSELRAGIEREEDDYIAGILRAAAAVYDSATYSAGDRTLRIRGMIAQLQMADYVPTGILLDPFGWFEVETETTTEGAYKFANPQNAANPRLWGLDVVASTKAVGTIVADFTMAAQGYDGQLQGEYGIRLRTGQPNNMFIENMYAVLAEERIAVAVKRPGALVYEAPAAS